MAGYYRRVRRRFPGLAILSALALLPPLARAAPPTPPARLGIADLATSADGQAAVATLRARLEGHAGIALSRDAARAALEEPLEHDGEAATPPRASTLLRAARDAYSRFDYDGALDRLRQTELALAGTPLGPEVTSLLVEVNLLAGVVDADRGDATHALEDFRVARRLDPRRAALDPGAYRPRVVALYAQAAAPEPRRVNLEVVTDPPGADVWIDGAPAGRAPVSASLEVGAHYVAAVAEGSAPRLEKPLLRAGESSRLSLLLARSSPEDRVRQARADLVAGRLGWDRGPGVLATSASLDVLVLVRDAPAGGAQAAVYAARAGTLGAWIPAVPPEPVLLAIATTLEAAAAAARAPLVAVREPREASPAAAVPWYRSWWLAPALVGVGAAVGLGTLWMIDRERTTTYAINRWCFGATCTK
jgi:hypothetical protein